MINQESSVARIMDSVYEFTRLYIDEYGYPPSHAEIAAGCNMGHSTVFKYLRRLDRAGRITVMPRVPRGIKVH